MTFCSSCGVELKTEKVNYCFNCGEILNSKKREGDKNIVHPLVRHLEKNPELFVEFISMISDEKLFKDVEEIKGLAVVFSSLPESVKANFTNEINCEINIMNRKVPSNQTLFVAHYNRKKNLQYILWALKNEDIELQLLRDFKGKEYHLYATNVANNEPSNKKTNNGANSVLDVADMFLSLTSPVGTMKYLIKMLKN